MLHFIIGTKAQFIKSIPCIIVATKQKIPCQIVDLGQHADITTTICDDFKLTTALTRPLKRNTSVSSYFEALDWLMSLSALYLLPKARLKAKLFGNDENPIAVVHGDTLSTLLGSILARKCNVRVGLIEAGLTSNRLFSPFPEEIIRRFVQRKASWLFCPGEQATNNAKKIVRSSQQVIDTGYNTGNDALSLILSGCEITSTGPAIATLHRLETISNEQKLRKALTYIVELSKECKNMIFVMHPPTARFIKKFKLEELISIPTIRIEGLKRYQEFAYLLAQAKFIVTDGGSIQEEAALLQKPCLILRNETERMDGIGQTSCLVTWQAQRDYNFLSETGKKGERLKTTFAASEKVIQILAES